LRKSGRISRADPGIEEQVRKLDDWEVVGRELTKGFYLDTFSNAIRFINAVADVAQEVQHHPDILLSEFSTVRIFIKTNEFGRVTQLDVDFAKRVEELWKKWRRHEKTEW